MAKTAKGLVEYAEAQLGKPYWYGSFGQLGTKDFYDQKKKQYPSYYNWSYDASDAGKKVHDCVGLIKGYLWCDSPTDNTPTYNSAQDVSANGMYSACKTKGAIATLPEVPGVLVFKDKHVGVYIGNGEVIEARGHDYGVVKTKVTDRGWVNWGYCPYIEYPVEEEVEEEKETANTTDVKLPVLKRGAKNASVKAMQILILGYGFTMEGYGADGSFGGATERALKKYQAANGLEADGSCGPKTWAKLLGV